MTVLIIILSIGMTFYIMSLIYPHEDFWDWKRKANGKWNIPSDHTDDGRLGGSNFWIVHCQFAETKSGC